MLDISRFGEILYTHSGQGQITFPQGARISANFTLTEYAGGRRLLTCSGRFAKGGYSTWEQLMNRYQIDPKRPSALKTGPLSSFAGKTVEQRELKIEQMALVGSLASEVGTNTLTLQMQFECQDVLISALPEQTTTI